jgi:iron complex outermembrane receptor protein
MVIRKHLRRSLLTSFAGTLLVPCPSRAQSADAATNAVQELPPIVVTGEVVGAAAQESPRPLTVLDGEKLKDSTIRSVRDLVAYAPNLTVADANGDRTPRFTIRGLRENNFSAAESAVGLYIDDVPYTDLSSRDAWFYDISDVEILRGPQGTFYGAARPGGLINITTRQPGNQWRGEGNVSYGNYDAVSVDAGVSGPVVKDQLFFSLSGIYAERDGYFNNTYLGTHPDDRETLSGRVQLRYKPSEHWDFAAIASGNRYRDGYIPAVDIYSADPFSVQRDYDGHSDTDSYNLAFKAAYEQESFRGVSVTTYRDWRQDILQDYDFSPFPIRLGFTQPKLQQFSEELRFHSTNKDAPLKWTGGAYYADQTLDGNSGSEELQAGGVNRTTSQQTGQNYAVFAQGAYRFAERFEFTGGLRYEYDDRRMTRSHVFEVPGFVSPLAPDADLSDHWDSLQPRVRFACDITPKSTFYATVARGYQSGGFNPSSDSATELRYDKSESWTYEVGTKSVCIQDKLVINAALFYTDTDDYQVFRPTPTLAAFNYQVMNAEKAYAMGAELEVTYTPVERLDLDAAFGYTYAKFDRFVDPYSGADFSGKRINFVPELTTTLGAQYKCSFGMLTRIETQIIGDTWFDEANTVKQQAYAVLNARIGYEKDNFGVYLFGRNLTDQRYFNNALDFGVDYGGAFLGTPGDPATYGIAVMGRF